VSADVFTTEVWTGKRLTRYLVFFLMDLVYTKSINLGDYLASEWFVDESSSPPREGCSERDINAKRTANGSAIC
jgi:hypothetical protein